MTQTPTARIGLADSKPAATVADALVVALAPGRGKKAEVIAPGLTAAVRAKLTESFNALGATGRSGDVTRIPGGAGIKAPVVVGLGLGDAAKQADAESLRRAVGEVIRSLAGTRRVALTLPIADGDMIIAGNLGEVDFVPRDDGSHGVYSKPLTVPGGVLGIDLPFDNLFGLAGVTSTVEAVDVPVFNGIITDFDVTLPVRLKIDNPFLGDNCYIGSAATPIPRRPRTAMRAPRRVRAPRRRTADCETSGAWRAISCWGRC